MNRMRTLIALVCLLGSTFQAALAQSDLSSYLRPDHPEEYLVQKGDTLWDISGRFLVQPWVWPELWRANPQIANPHLIYPGDLIRLIYIDGQPYLTVERGEDGRTYRLSRNTDTERLEPRIRAEPILSAIPAIRMEAIASFLVGNRIVEEEALENAPYVLGGGEGRMVIGAGDTFYVRGDTSAAESSLAVVRRGPAYVDPDTGELLGIEATELGTARIVANNGEVTSMQTLVSRIEIRRGALVLPTEERTFDSSFFPKAPNLEVDGRIISVHDGGTQIGQYDVVVVNRGSREGLEVGDVMTVMRRGAEVRDRIGGGRVRLPSEAAGLMMVFRVFEKLSYGIILENTRALAVLDEVRNP
jgi:hypothetical protein